MTRHFYVTIEGVRQGRLRGEAADEQHREKILGLAFLYEIEVARTAPSGRSRGARKHSPVVFVKAWDSASPQLFQALINNEMLRAVTFEFVRVNANDGTDEVYHTIRLIEASILTIKQEINPSKSDSFPDYPAIERVALTFQRIEIESKARGIIAADEWSTGA